MAVGVTGLAVAWVGVASLVVVSMQAVVSQEQCGPGASVQACDDGYCCSQYGYCGTSDDDCGSGCQIEYGSCSGGSGDGSCFPASAMVTTRSGITKPMLEIGIGEEVAVWTENGEIEYDHVYAHGHLDGEALSEFVVLKLCGLQQHANETRTLELTPDHFAIVTGSKILKYKRAKDIKVGDAMLGLTSDLCYTPFYVLEAKKKVLKGLYNPYTMRGTIIVNNVLASCHSKWFLESTFDRLHLSHLLPSFYQAMLLPVRILYRGMGKDSYKRLYDSLDSCYDIAKSSTCTSGYLKLVVVGLWPFPSIHTFCKKENILEGNMIKMLPK